MATDNVLSDGAIDQMMEQKNDGLFPVVQLLGTKTMNNNRVRAIISDGQNVCQHCIFISEEIERQFNDGLLSKFTVVRLEQFTVSAMPKKENMPVLLVNRISILKSGEEINRKLNSGEPFQESSQMQTDSPAISALSSSSFNRQSPSAPKPAAKPAAFTGPNTLKSENVCPIKVLTPFFNSWLIRVRVTNKTPLKTYKNTRGDGKLFSFDCCDEDGEIRVTAFNTECDKYYDLIERGKVYLISRGSIKNANKKFCALNNDYEITLNPSSVIEPCFDDSLGSIQIRYKFIPLSELNNIAPQTLVDVIGIIRSIGEAENLTSRKTGKEMTKRDITIGDTSLAEVRFTVWNDAATSFEGEVGQVIALKGSMVGDFKGKTLSAAQSTLIQIEPDIAETQVIRNWYEDQGTSVTFTSLSKSDGPSVGKDIRLACQISPELVVDAGGASIYSNMYGMILSTNRTSNHLYKSCGNNGCMKKVTDDSNGVYTCGKCERTVPTFEWRLMLSIQVTDPTGSIWLTAFQEQAEKLIGMTTKELADLYEQNESEYTRVINQVRFKDYYFRIGSRLDEYNNEKRVRSQAYNIIPHSVNPADRAKRLMNIIDVLSEQVSA